MVEKGLKDAGYQYINVDDGYFGKRDENGVMQANEKRFPNGMKPVALPCCSPSAALPPPI